MATVTESFPNAAVFGGDLAWTPEAGTWLNFTNEGYKATTAAAHELCRLTNAQSSADHYAQKKITQVTGGKFYGPACRMSPGANSGYAFAGDGTTAYIILILAGAQDTIVANASYTYVAGQIWRIEAEGTTIRGRVNGSFVCSGTNSVLSGMHAGVYSADTNGTFDDFEAGELTAAVAVGSGLINGSKFNRPSLVA